MKIPQKFSLLQRENALIVVAGKEGAVFYEISNEEVSKKLEIRLPKEREEREGFFARGGRGRIFEMGGVFEPKKRKKIKKLIGEIEKNLREVLEKDSKEKIYLFVPAYLSKRMISTVEKIANGKVRLIKKGNFLSSHPLKLLELIVKQHEAKKVIPISDEAKKLLDRFKTVKHFFKKSK
ncbi:hypothetical protein J7K92_01990 [bacterium]|nr:hypothetical protein [bacterium]